MLAQLTAPLRAQCLDWRTFPYILPELTGDGINTSLVYNDGSGPALYIGGWQLSSNDAFGAIFRWNGSHVESLGAGLN